MSEYKHGAYAEILTSNPISTAPDSGTVVLYFGLLPIHQRMDYKGLVNEPLLLSQYGSAVKLCGYTEDWTYSVCEGIYAHFCNSLHPVGPIAVLNAFDPDIHRKEEKASQELVFAGRRAAIQDGNVILGTLSIPGKELGKDYTAAYSEDGLQLILTDISEEGLGRVTAEYFQADPSLVTEDDLVKCVSRAGLAYVKLGIVPTVLCAPGWSSKKAVAQAMKLAAGKLSGHWYAYCSTDLPEDAVSIEAAIQGKTALAADGHNESPCWPMGRKAGRYFHLSTLAAVTMQWRDSIGGGVPGESASNLPIDIDGLAVKKDGEYREIFFDETEANRLNARGIRTAVYRGGGWRLWGPHTGAYAFGVSLPPEHIFDSSVRMLQYIANQFQARYMDEIDRPIRRSRVETILNDFGEWLDGMVSDGFLLAASIGFEEEDNLESDMVQGSFVYNVRTNTAPAIKDITARISHTSEGLSLLFGEEEENG